MVDKKKEKREFQQTMISPMEFFKEKVLPRCEAYFQQPTNQDKAEDATLWLAPFYERVFLYHEYHDPARLQGAKDANHLLQILSMQPGGKHLPMVHQSGKAIKHHYLERTHNPVWPHTTTGTVVETQTSGLCFDGNPEWSVRSVLREVVSFWETWLDLR